MELHDRIMNIENPKGLIKMMLKLTSELIKITR